MEKKYSVYGIGNALVDMEFEVSTELLTQLKIDKGVMTLMTEEQQHQVLLQLQDYGSKQSCGGSAANTMVAIAQLGGKSFYSCKVAQDDTGKFFLKDLSSYGIDTNLHNGQHQPGITGKCLVMVTPDADRTMNTFLGISATLSEEELVPDALADSQYLYMEGYLVSSPTAKNAAIKARNLAQQSGVKTALSLSDANMVQFFKDGLLEIIGDGLDFIFANEIEALKMADTDDIKLAIEHLKTLANSFAITRGGKGSLVFDGDILTEIAPVKVTAIDTVGAGDMYAGAFLYGITQGMSFAQAGNLASAASAQLVTRFGARLETKELQALLT